MVKLKIDQEYRTFELIGCFAVLLTRSIGKPLLPRVSGLGRLWNVNGIWLYWSPGSGFWVSLNIMKMLHCLWALALASLDIGVSFLHINQTKSRHKLWGFLFIIYYYTYKKSHWKERRSLPVLLLKWDLQYIVRKRCARLWFLVESKMCLQLGLFDIRGILPHWNGWRWLLGYILFAESDVKVLNFY